MLEGIGCAVLGLGAVGSSILLLATWQLYARHPTLAHGVILVFVLSHAYSCYSLLLGGALPLRYVYQRPDLLEMLHRSRYLIFDCASLPCILWLLALLAHRAQFFGAGTLQLDESWRIGFLIICSLVHLVIAGLAASDCSKYPFTTESCLGVVYWRPTRFTPRMRGPWLWVTRGLWLFATSSLCLERRGWLLVGTAAFQLAFHGHMSQYRYWPSEIYMQPLATAMLSAALLANLDVGLACNWRTLDPGSCLVLAPGGAVPLFGAGMATLRF
mmetsp:Transcript_4394/g.8804  ORF Transcript_4394/g.8804 Transcript_4394/m.8804 type:complete len:271 (+) Transcript_4394:89-901(+)